MAYRYIKFFSEIGIEDVPSVGGKNASLGEMYRELTPKGIKVPNGFAITAEAYMDIIKLSGRMEELRQLLSDFNAEDVRALAERGKKARDLVYTAPWPKGLEEEVFEAYQALVKEYGQTLSVAVRSSATAEDLPTASFAGQQETYLNVKGKEDLIEACRLCFASLFNDRAIHYRLERGFDHFKVALSIAVMKMVRSDLASSGVMFTLDTESGFRDVVFITGAYGLGETVVQGAVDPDEFFVHKPTYKKGFRSVLRRLQGRKEIKMIYDDSGAERVKTIPTSEEERKSFCLSDEEALALAGHAITIEDHYTAKAGVPRPMDIEWAKDGLDHALYIVQARPETVAAHASPTVIREYEIESRAPVLVTGRAVGGKIAAGKARVVKSIATLHEFEDGDVLVADMTAPDWEPVMKRASAIVTNRGGRTCHAAIIAREFGIPAVVGAVGATTKLQDGQEVTISCAEGEIGKVYQGKVPFKVREVDLEHLSRPVTKIMMNVGNPEMAFSLSSLPCDGIGLARMEFIIESYIKAHPMALLYPERVEAEDERQALADLVKGYASPQEFFIRQLSEGVATIAAAFYPKPVVVRLSDFKTNEYASLLGGKPFEPVEPNPMLGLRGAARYTHPLFAEAFAMECAAMKRARDEMGMTNIKLMVPFCRRVEEAAQVIDLMAKDGLRRGENGLDIYVMCEIPNNAIQIDAFAKYFDGFSIGSNDLAQLVLGVDRDSELVAHDYDERDPGVLALVKMAVEGAKRNGRYSGICGQAPSDYPEIAEYLVRLGIESMSLNPDTVLKTTLRVLEIEKELGRTHA